MSLTELYTAVQKVNPQTIVDEVLEELKDYAIELNLSQLEEGKNAKGGRFRKYANKQYARKKAGMNSKPGFGNPDLKLTGDFWAAFTAEIKEGIEVYSTDKKADWLENGTAKMKPFIDIYGLTPSNLNKLRTEFLIRYNDKLRAEIGLS